MFTFGIIIPNKAYLELSQNIANFIVYTILYTIYFVVSKKSVIFAAGTKHFEL